MRLKIHEYSTVICEDCGREVSSDDNYGCVDIPLCSGCAARRHQEFVKIKCKLCKKPLGDKSVCYNIEDYDIFAHSDCVDKLSDEEAENWSDDWG